MPLFLLLVAVPVVEIALFIQVGGWIGVWWTIVIVLLTAALGTALLRAQGLAALAEVQGALQRGGNPAPALAHGALILVAGVLLLTPGFFTDFIGFLLLAPPVRALVIRYLASRMTVVQARGGPGQGTAGRPGGFRAGASGAGTVDGEYQVIDPEGTAETPAPGDAGKDSDRDANVSGWTRVPDRRTEG